MTLLAAAQEHVLAQDSGRERFTQAVVELSKAFALAVPRAEVLAVRDEVAFFQAVKAALVKTEVGRARPEDDLDHAIRQIVAGAIVPGEVIDVFTAAGLQKPDPRSSPKSSSPRFASCRSRTSPSSCCESF